MTEAAIFAGVLVAWAGFMRLMSRPGARDVVTPKWVVAARKLSVSTVAFVDALRKVSLSAACASDVIRRLNRVRRRARRVYSL